MFRRDDVAHGRPSTMAFFETFDPGHSLNASRFTLASNISPALLDIAADMTSLSWLLNDALTGRRPKVDMMDGCMAMWEVGYRLLNFIPLTQPSPENYMDNIVHLGLLMFMLPFLQKLDGNIPECPTIYKLAHSAARGHLGNTHDGADHSVVLWMLLVGASSAFKPSDYVYISPIMERLTLSLNIGTWEDVAGVLAGFPWIDALFLTAAQSLFNDAVGVSKGLANCRC